MIDFLVFDILIDIHHVLSKKVDEMIAENCIKHVLGIEKEFFVHQIRVLILKMKLYCFSR